MVTGAVGGVTVRIGDGRNKSVIPGMRTGKSWQSPRGGPGSRLDDAPPDGVANEAGRVVNLEFVHDSGSVGLGALHGEAQERGDLLRRVSLGKQLKRMALPGRQRIRRQIAAGQITVDDDPGHGGAQIDTAPGDHPYRLDQVFRGLGLDDIALDPRPEGGDDLVILGVHGQEDDPGPGARPEDLAGCVGTVQLGHGEVEDGHVRAFGLGKPNGLLAIRGFTRDLEPLSLQKNPETLANDLVVVRKDDAQRHPNLRGHGDRDHQLCSPARG